MPNFRLVLELDLEFYAILHRICAINGHTLEDALIEGLTDLLAFTDPTLLRKLSYRKFSQNRGHT
jgi:hypothetical protein